MARALIDYLVLDALADDFESMEQIEPDMKRALEFWCIDEPASKFSRAEIVLAITRLIRDRLVEAVALNSDGKSMSNIGEGVHPKGNLDDYWFGMTARGKIVHTGWNPPAERDSKSRLAT
jgi:hypothetical protein